ncbi:MAG: PTS sugar transporter subunit IIC [Aerococcus sp.]|nr:PTS sugar transporter subunit IIC [Aerococcus sp.]
MALEIQWWQILVLTLYAGYQILDELQLFSALNSPVFAGMLAGLVMGDMTTGLKIGASMQLMVLGVGTFGGASKIDANTGAIVATVFSIILGMTPEQAVGSIGVAVATILVQLDILARMANTFFQHRIDTAIEEENYSAVETNFLLGALPWALSRAVPVGLALTFGAPLVEKIVEWLNGPLLWLGDGLSLAGAVLPGVGFAILLRYLPVSKHFPYLILGFTITALLKTLFDYFVGLGGALAEGVEGFAMGFNGLPMFAIAMIGFALGAIRFKQSSEKSAARPVQQASATDAEQEGEIEDDEL